MNLALTDEIPVEISNLLRGHIPLLQRTEHSDDFFDHEPLLEIVQQLDSFCKSASIVGVHYTRAEQSEISSRGLLRRTGAECRDAFLKDHGHRLTDAQRTRLVVGWNSYFDENQNKVRDGRIWFNLTRSAMSGRGAAPLLSRYGGEAIYMPFWEDDELSTILFGLGDPMVVECVLPPASCQTFCLHPWGRTWLSTYHCSVNPRAFQWDVDLFIEESVPPSSILRIEVQKELPHV